jgi:hypothetical protein
MGYADLKNGLPYTLGMSKRIRSGMALSGQALKARLVRSPGGTSSSGTFGAFDASASQGRRMWQWKKTKPAA